MPSRRSGHCAAKPLSTIEQGAASCGYAEFARMASDQDGNRASGLQRSGMGLNWSKKMGVQMKPLRLIVALMVVAAWLSLRAPEAEARINIGVGVSANGYVMEDVPTSIAASGFKGTGKLYVFDDALSKWAFIGNIRSGRALPYTFLRHGATQLKLVTKQARPRIVVVEVYGRITSWRSVATAYGPLVLASRYSGATISAPATGKCVLVDIGGVDVGRGSFTLQVLSTGAPEFRLVVPQGAGVGTPSVPVSGDAVVNAIGRPADAYYGAVWTCLNFQQDADQW